MQNYNVYSTKKFDADEIPQNVPFSLESHDFIYTRCIKHDDDIKRIKALTNHRISAVITSKNAVLCLHSMLQNEIIKWDFYCISGKTKSTILKCFPYSQVIASEKNATLLIRKMKQQVFDKLYFFAGTKSLKAVPNYCNAYQIPMEQFIIYETVLSPISVNKAYDAYLFFSPSGVSSYFSINKLPKNAIAVAIGETTAKALLIFAPYIILIAQEPTLEAMIMELKKYYDKE